MDPLEQVCAVAFRRCDQRLEFCLITSLKKRWWGFPKGIVESHQNLAEAARQEALEEAGLLGTVVGQPLGSYADRKWNRELRVTGVLFEVHQVLDEWPEMPLRQRIWNTTEEAISHLKRDEQRELLRVALTRIGQ